MRRRLLRRSCCSPSPNRRFVSSVPTRPRRQMLPRVCSPGVVSRRPARSTTRKTDWCGDGKGSGTDMELPIPLDPIDARVTSWMARHGIAFTRIALGVVFLWFGALKFVPAWSPAADLATRTIAQLTGGMIGPVLSLKLLATWETLIGLGLLSGMFLRATLL